jgi:hypothetical protein
MSRGFVYGFVWRDFAIGFCTAKLCTVVYEEYDVQRRHERLLKAHEEEKRALRDILNKRAWTEEESLRHGKLMAWSYLSPRVGLVVPPNKLEPLA